MGIKCVRCRRKIENANENNAKYIINPGDLRTWGKDKVEKIIKAPLTQGRIQDILNEKSADQREFNVNEKGEPIIIEHPFTMQDFLASKEIFPDRFGRREIITEEEISKPKTAIVCLECLEEEDTVIW